MIIFSIDYFVFVERNMIILDGMARPLPFCKILSNIQRSFIMNYNEQKNYIGHMSQLFCVKQYKFDGGWADGVRAVDISNGTGLSFTVLVDRCMDIFYLTYKGKNVAYQTPVGIKAPQYFERESWMRGFGAGFFVTCGLENTGNSSFDNDEALPAHGRVSDIPANNFSLTYSTEDGVPTVTLYGEMSQCVMFGTQLTLCRTIKCKYGEDKIYLADVVKNSGARQTPHMMLYHFNMGYPLFDENAEVNIPSQKLIPRSELAASESDQWMKFDPPSFGYNERCYYHLNMKEENGVATVGMKNKKSDLSVSISYETKHLPWFCQWKMQGVNEYVCGLEPCNATIEGRADARENGTLQFMEPNEEREYNLIVTVGSYQ